MPAADMKARCRWALLLGRYLDDLAELTAFNDDPRGPRHPENWPASLDETDRRILARVFRDLESLRCEIGNLRTEYGTDAGAA